MNWKIAVTGLLLIGGVSLSQAQVFTPGISVHKFVQDQRIKSGIRSGELTPREVRKLHREQLRLVKLENRMKADGNFSRMEHTRFRVKQRKASAHIYREKHDGQRS